MRFYMTWGELDHGSISAPILVYNGEQDKPMQASLLEHFNKIYPQARTSVLEGHGHSTMILELRKILLEFVTCTDTK